MDGERSAARRDRRPDSEARRLAAQARARERAEAREETERIERIERRLPLLRARAGAARRLLAALVGSRAAGLPAGDRGRRPERRRRFRLARRERVLERGLAGLRAPRAAPPADSRPTRRAAGADPDVLSIRVAGHDRGAALLGGDLALARSLAGAIEALGQRAVVRLSGEADESGAAVELTLRGRPTGEPTPGRVNLLWLISHPEEAGDAELGRYDRVLVASRRHAALLARRLHVPVEYLPQFTDPATFHPDPDPSRAHRLLFVGNWRGEFRRIVWDAIEAGHPPALYGQGWDLLAPEHAVAEHIPHAQLRRLYSSCEVLLCDHWGDMRRQGFVANRVFDALASGAFVLADDNPGIGEELPGAVETYASQSELGAKLERYLADPEARQRMARRGHHLVLARHTAQKRAEWLLAIAADALRRGDRSAGGASAAAAGARDAGAGPG